MKNKILCLILFLSFVLLISIPSFAVPFDVEYEYDDVLRGTAYKLKPHIELPFNGTLTGIVLAYTLSSVDEYVYNKVSILENGSVVLESTVEGTDYPPRLLYDSSGNLVYNGYVSFLDDLSFPSSFLEMIYAPVGVEGSYTLTDLSYESVYYILNGKRFYYNGELFDGVFEYNNVLAFSREDDTYLVIAQDSIFNVESITITFADTYLLNLQSANYLSAWEKTPISSSPLASQYFVFTDSLPYYTIPFSLDISGISSYSPLSNFNHIDFTTDSITLWNNNTGVPIFDGYSVNNSLIKFDVTNYGNVLSQLGYSIDKLSLSNRNISTNFSFIFRSTLNDRFYYSSEGYVFTVSNGNTTYFSGGDLIADNGRLFIANNERIYEVEEGMTVSFYGSVDSNLYYKMLSFGDVLIDDVDSVSILDFFDNLFSLPERAMSNLVLFETPNGTIITLFTVVSTAISLAFIFWILKLIAGG